MDRTRTLGWLLCLMAGCSAPISTTVEVPAGTKGRVPDISATEPGPSMRLPEGAVPAPTVGSTGYRQVSLGGAHGCAVREDDSLWCWGDNEQGQIGDGTTERRYLPVPIAGHYRSVTAGEVHTCAIDGAGALHCWGAGGVSPVRIGNREGWTQVSAGGEHTCAIRAGDLYCWGRNEAGQLGDGSLDQVAYDPRLVGSGYLVVAAGGAHTCALRSDGSLRCWGAGERTPQPIGAGSYAQLAAGEQSSCAVAIDGSLWCWQTGAAPARVGNEIGWLSVELRGAHACGLREGGDLRCWGDNAWGQLGDGSSVPHAAPAPVAVAITFTRLSVGTDFTCALHEGRLVCWGLNDKGQLAIGEPRKYAPVRVGTGSFDMVAAAARSTCARAIGGQLWCWGDNASGELGFGDQSWESQPRGIDYVSNWTALSGGDRQRCAVRGGQTVWCWGDGRLSPGLMAMAGPIADVSSAAGYGCALRFDGSVRCWGDGVGQLGTVPGSYRRISTGANHACGIRTDGTVWCWGDAARQRLGEAIGDPSGPVQAVAGNDFLEVSAGDAHTCALHADGTLSCWGAGDHGQLGNGGTSDRAAAIVVAASVSPFVAVSAGATHTCAIASDRSLWCWGDDSEGQIGDGIETAGTHLMPVQIGHANDWLSASAARSHTCGVRGGGSLWCWGSNRGGEVGDGTAFRKDPSL